MGQVFVNHTSEEGLISGIYKELLQLKQKDKQSISKWEELEQTLLQRRYTKGP